MLKIEIEQHVERLPWSGCWIWMRACSKAGYGQFTKNSKVHYVHRAMLAPVPAGMQVLHKCDTPPCCNPSHLFFGTMADNMADKCAKGRQRGAVAGDKRAAKITRDQVIAIRNDRRTLRVIAADYGLSISNISAIKNRITWRDA